MGDFSVMSDFNVLTDLDNKGDMFLDSDDLRLPPYPVRMSLWNSTVD